MRLAVLFSKFEYLKLDFSGNNINDAAVSYLVDALKGLENKQAHRITLQLENNGLSGESLTSVTDAFMSILAEQKDNQYVNTNLKWAIHLGNKPKNNEKRNYLDGFILGDFRTKYGSASVITLFKRANGHEPFVNVPHCGKFTTQVEESMQDENKSKSKKTYKEDYSEEIAEKALEKISQEKFLKKTNRKLENKRKEALRLKKLEYAKGYHVVMRREGLSTNNLLTNYRENKSIRFDEYRENKPIRFDDENSSIFSTRDYKDFRVDVNQTNDNPSPSNDKVVLGYSLQGLPFQIMVTGLKDKDRVKLFKFIDDHVLRLIPTYAGNLSQGSMLPAKIMKEFIEQVNKLGKDKIPGIRYGLSVAISYEAHETLYCAYAGFGSAPGLVYMQSASESLQLEYDSQSQANVMVHRGGALLCYTSLCHELLTTEGDKHFKLNVAALKATPETLYEEVKAENLSMLHLARLDAQRDKKEYDTHSMLSVMRIPSKELQNFIKEYVRLNSSLAEVSKKEQAESDLKKQELYRKLGKAGRRFIDKMDELKATTDAEALSDLTQHIKVMNRVLEDPTEKTLTELLAQAKKAQGAPSHLLQGLGIAMMVMGGLVAAIGGLVIAAAFVATVSGFFAPVGVPSFEAGVGIAAGGATVLLTGIGFFAAGRHRIGLSKAMDDAAQIIIKNNYESITP